MLVTSMREAARRIGVSHTCLQKAQRAGRIAQEPCGRWDVVAIQRQLAVPPAQKDAGPQRKLDRAPQGASATPRPLPRPSPSGPSMREVARQLGVSHTSLQKARRTGRISPEPDGSWDIEKVRAGLATRAAPSRVPRGCCAPVRRCRHRAPRSAWPRAPAPAAPKPREPYGSRAPWARVAHQIAQLDADIVGPARSIHEELETARQALERAARQIAALYPEILRLERAHDAAVAAQERGRA